MKSEVKEGRWATGEETKVFQEKKKKVILNGELIDPGGKRWGCGC